MNTLSLRFCFIGALLLFLSACAFKPYQFQLQQGNVIPGEKVAEIEAGMSEDQVRFLLGTPMLQDVFHTERWDYVYYLKPEQSDKVIQRHLIVYFDQGKVKSFSQGTYPIAPKA